MAAEAQRSGAAFMAARHLKTLLAGGRDPIHLPGHETLSFLQLHSAAMDDPIELVRYRHEPAPRAQAQLIEAHEEIETWYVYRPNANRLDCFVDDMEDERQLMDEGRFADIPKLRTHKLEAIQDPDNISLIDFEEAVGLTTLLKLAAGCR